jgi:uncharacterized coiled-coil DUF342 family protein
MNKCIVWFVYLLILIPIGCNNETGTKIDAQTELNLFIMDMNPELYQTTSKMREEIALADKKIQQLYDLKGMFPDQRDMINGAIKQWQTLRKQLVLTSDNINKKVEGAYVAYKIDEIQGRKKFSMMSQKLLEDSKTVLADAEIIKSTIEKELNE